LTIDAQSALRRCIELFSHTTRFFIIVEDKYKLLKPILSRFCEIYVPEPIYNGYAINLYKFNLAETFKLKDFKTQRSDWLKKELNKVASNENVKREDLLHLSTKLYEKGYSGLDLMQLLEKPNSIKIAMLTEEKQYTLLFAFNKVRKEFRNEKILIMFILNFLFLSLEHNLENISFM
jgi:DNA polymerase III delta prime subunit